MRAQWQTQGSQKGGRGLLIIWLATRICVQIYAQNSVFFVFSADKQDLGAPPENILAIQYCFLDNLFPKKGVSPP